jgi:hypothetical protein
MLNNSSQIPAGAGTDAAAMRAAADFSPTGDATAAEARERIQRLPPEVGAVLVAVGIAGMILPGPVGTPLLLAGGLALMPSVFGRAERWVEKRFPSLHWHGMKNVHRFIDDLERRFPPSGADSPDSSPQHERG